MPVTFDDCEAVHETDKALLVIIPDLDKGEPVWVPQSQIHDDSDVHKLGTSGKLIITEWFAQQKKWI